MAVHHLKAALTGMGAHRLDGGQIAGAGQSGHGDAPHVVGQTIRKLTQLPLAHVVTGGGVAEEADAVAGPGLFGRQIAHVAEQPADGGAKDVQDVQRVGHRLRTSARARR